MSEHEWQPGDVAMVRGDVCLRTENGLWEHGRGDRFAYHAVEDVPHPLVVIDPESAEQVERLYDLFSDTAHESPVDGLQAALREFAAPKPPHHKPAPKPPEPTGQGAVVVDTADRRWIRRILGGRSPWAYYDEVERSTTVRDWDEIDAVRVLSEGVQP